MAADCKSDANVCTFNRCTGDECRFEAVKYGNVNGDPNNLVNLDDILCTLDGFAKSSNCPNSDIAPPCAGDNVINLDDILSVMSAFSGANPCGCVVP